MVILRFFEKEYGPTYLLWKKLTDQKRQSKIEYIEISKMWIEFGPISNLVKILFAIFYISVIILWLS